MGKFLLPFLLTTGGIAAAGGTYIYTTNYGFSWLGIEKDSELEKTSAQLKKIAAEIEEIAEALGKKTEFKMWLGKISLLESIQKITTAELVEKEEEKQLLKTKKEEADASIKKFETEFPKTEDKYKLIYEKAEEFKVLVRKSYDQLFQDARNKNDQNFTLYLDSETYVTVSLWHPSHFSDSIMFY